MNIAIDFDDTYTADPELWDGFIKLCKSRGHSCFIVTMRSDNKNNRDRVNSTLINSIPVVYCGGRWKKNIVESHEIKIDIWIDDLPFLIQDQKDIVWNHQDGASTDLKEFLDSEEEHLIE